MKWIIIFFLMIPIVSAGLIYEEELIWNFTVIQNDTDIYTNTTVLNLTMVEITIDKRHPLPGNYRWHMALCNFTPMENVFYYEEDHQGGFNYSTPIPLNFDRLEYYGMPTTWCPYQNNTGFVLFSNGGRRLLPKHFRLEFPEYAPHVWIYTGTGSELIDGNVHNKGTQFSPNENIYIGKGEDLHACWIDSGRDLWYGVSNDNGSTWNTGEVHGGSANFGEAGIIGRDGNIRCYAQRIDENPNEIQYKEFLEGAPLFPPDMINITANSSTGNYALPSCIMNKSHQMTCCAIRGSNRLQLIYGDNLGVEHTLNFTSNEERCDIAVNRNGSICITTVSTDVAVFCNKDGWNRRVVETNVRDPFSISTAEYAPTIAVDAYDKFYIAYASAGGGFTVNAKLANFSTNDMKDIDIIFLPQSSETSLYFPEIAISTQNTFMASYNSAPSLTATGVFYLFRRNYTGAWSEDPIHVPTLNTGGYVSFADSIYPAHNNMKNVNHIVFTNRTGSSYSVRYTNRSLDFPTCFWHYNSSWNVNLEDRCTNYIEYNLMQHTFSTFGNGYFISDENIIAFNLSFFKPFLGDATSFIKFRNSKFLVPSKT